MSKELILEKYISVAVKKALKEQEEHHRRAEKSMYLVYRFPGLKKIMEDMMTPAFAKYINNISITAPRPTTFKIELINNQDFYIKYLGKGKFNVKISGKKYNPSELGELERASQSIADLLELNYAPEEGKEQNPEGNKNPETSSSTPSFTPPSDTSGLEADLTGPESEPIKPTELPPGVTPPEEEETPSL